MEQKAEIKINFSQEQALVFFEWLSRISEQESFKKLIEDESEQIVIDSIICDLESILPEPFLENYQEILQKYRERIRTSFGNI